MLNNFNAELFTDYRTASNTSRTILGRLFGWSRPYFYFHMMRDCIYLPSTKVRSSDHSELVSLYIGSWKVVGLIENCGGSVNFINANNLAKVDGPVVLVSNHMSLLETLLFPAFSMAFKPLSFVVKQSLLELRWMKDVLKEINCIGLDRVDPIADYKKIIKEGIKVIKNGQSIVVFPQSSRSKDIDIDSFGSAGVKLAKRAGVPIVPVAVKTDFIENGKIFKDFGVIHRDRPVYMEAGEPIEVVGNGKEAHKQCVDFIVSRLESWKDDKK